MTPPTMAGPNLALRFALELVALVGLGMGAWTLVDTPLRWVGVIVVPVAGTVAWGAFGVSNDPSRGADPPVAVPGWVRLAIELMVFGGGVAGLALGGWSMAALVVGVVTIGHYVASLPRVRWLLEQ